MKNTQVPQNNGEIIRIIMVVTTAMKNQTKLGKNVHCTLRVGRVGVGWGRLERWRYIERNVYEQMLKTLRSISFIRSDRYMLIIRVAVTQQNNLVFLCRSKWKSQDTDCGKFADNPKPVCVSG